MNICTISPRRSQFPIDLFKDRSGFVRAFRTLLYAEPSLKGRVLDIGCGKGRMNELLSDFPQQCSSLDGVDPSEDVLEHPFLINRWHSTFEDAPIPPHAYDLAVAYNVVEHLRHPENFMRQLARVLKPGGVFWALTPHALHPFCWISRTLQEVGLKHGIASRHKNVNDYPAYYRLNRKGKITRLAQRNGFSNATIYYFPCENWDSYFPRVLKWAPHLFDAAVGMRLPQFMQILAFRLQC